MGVAEGLVNEADLGTWFISERLRDGRGEVAKRSECLLFVYVCCILLLRVLYDLFGGRAHGRCCYLLNTYYCRDSAFP
jgi:hypothetical protein